MFASNISHIFALKVRPWLWNRVFIHNPGFVSTILLNHPIIKRSLRQENGEIFVWFFISLLKLKVTNRKTINWKNKKSTLFSRKRNQYIVTSKDNVRIVSEKSINNKTSRCFKTSWKTKDNTELKKFDWALESSSLK